MRTVVSLILFFFLLLPHVLILSVGMQAVKTLWICAFVGHLGVLRSE